MKEVVEKLKLAIPGNVAIEFQEPDLNKLEQWKWNNYKNPILLTVPTANMDLLKPIMSAFFDPLKTAISHLERTAKKFDASNSSILCLHGFNEMDAAAITEQTISAIRNTLIKLAAENPVLAISTEALDLKIKKLCYDNLIKMIPAETTGSYQRSRFKAYETELDTAKNMVTFFWDSNSKLANLFLTTFQENLQRVDPNCCKFVGISGEVKLKVELTNPLKTVLLDSEQWSEKLGNEDSGLYKELKDGQNDYKKLEQYMLQMRAEQKALPAPPPSTDADPASSSTTTESPKPPEATTVAPPTKSKPKSDCCIM